MLQANYCSHVKYIAYFIELGLIRQIKYNSMSSRWSTDIQCVSSGFREKQFSKEIFKLAIFSVNLMSVTEHKKTFLGGFGSFDVWQVLYKYFPHLVDSNLHHNQS